MANRFEAILLIALCTLIVRQSLSISSENTWSGFFYFLSQGIIFLIGPSILFHFQSLSNRAIPIKRILSHYSLAIITTVCLVVLFLNRWTLINVNNTPVLKVILFSFISLQIVHLISYLFLARREIKLYEAKYGQYHTAVSRINLRWMKQLITVIFLFSFLVLAMYFLILSGGYYQMNNNADLIFLLAIALIIMRIVITSWRQPEVSSGIYKDESKYKTSPLSSSESNKLTDRLNQLLSEQQVYRTAELTLNQLAKMLEVPPYILSQLINQEYQQNFFNFINDFRIEYASQQIVQGKLNNITLAGLAYEAGFNSKSTFNRAFKKKMGCTPKEYGKAKRPMQA